MPYQPKISPVIQQHILVAPPPPPPVPPPPPGPPPPPPPPGTALLDQLVLVAMENRDQSEIYHNSAAPFLSQLADDYGFAQHWRSTTNPSQPNYIDVIGGSTFGVAGNGGFPLNLNHPTIVDIIENAGRTWKAIAEGATGTGANLRPPRVADHFPFLSFTTIVNNAARAVHMIPGDHTQVIAQLNAGVNFVWYTPTDNHNMHNNSVSSGDAWLASWIPSLLSAMAGKRAALCIWWDEAYTNPPYIYLAFAGPACKARNISSTEFIHPSLIKLLEDVWGGGNLGQRDVAAASPREFFQGG